MTAKLSRHPTIHPTAIVNGCELGAWTEVGAHTMLSSVVMGDYSYIVEYGDVVWTNIGKFCSIARDVRINPGNHPTWRVSQHHFSYRAASYDMSLDDEEFFQWRRQHMVTIGHDVWIGHGVTILPGVTIGHGAVIGAGAVVSKNVPNYTMMGGVPAQIIKRRFTEEQEERLLALAFWDWRHQEITDRLFDIRHLPIDAFLDKYLP